MRLLPRTARNVTGNAAAFAVLVLAGVLAHSAASAQNLTQGRKLAEQYCARCHAVGPAGASPHPSAPPFRAVAAKGHVDDLQEALAEGITVGHPDMPEFEFSPEQITNFLSYLKGLAPAQ
jgi:cytochrome c